jgi:hypothetical protein
MLWMAAVCYLGRMWHRATAAGMIQTALLSLGLTGLSSNAAEAATKPPVPLVTNVVAQRVVRDVIQTLLQVTAATNLSAPVNGSTLPPQTALPGSVQVDRPQSDTNWAAVVEQAGGPGVMLITNTFAGFVPGSLAEAIWAGFHTNGRSTKMWEFWELPAGWPTNPPVLRWNTNNLMWGRKGMTAISQVCEGMGAFGQGALTILTRRHAYLRGHSMGVSGLHPEKVGKRVWYCTRDNQVIERKVQLLLVRAREPGSPGDYSIVLFDADLPAAIEPMRVVDQGKAQRKYLDYRFDDPSHKPLFMALQGGFVSAGVPGWTVSIGGGDSGNPIMLPLPDELVFYGGVTTSPPSAAMQADMDMLSRQAGLDPRQYQMQWVNLDSYPDF